MKIILSNMNKFFIPIILFISLYNISQEIDPALLENLSPAQIEMAKAQLSSGNPLTISKPKPKVSESTIKVSLDNNKYGYDYFSSIPTSVTAVGDLPLPSDYKISLNDQFTVILSGSKEAIFDLNVNLDGTILFPELGSISVVGETLKEIKTKFKNLIEQSYIGVQIDLSLKNLSAKKITIVGAVNTPGTYLVNPFSTISSALAYSGGVSEVGTLRNIRLTRVNGDTYNFDLYKLLINGDRSDDITIESGDVIFIGPADQFITLSGQVRRPATYEINKGETLEDLVTFGLGFTRLANKSNISLRVLDIESSSVKNINVSDFSSSLIDVMNVDVKAYVNKNIASINVVGSVNEPGYYSIDQNDTLEALINRLDFIDVYPWLAVLEQFDEENLVKSSTLFSLNDPDTYQSIELLPNSRVVFNNINSRDFSNVAPMTKNLISEFQLRINHKQGQFSLPVVGKYSIKSFVDFLGLDMSDTSEIATYISPLESIVNTMNYKDMNYFGAKYHTVNFRSSKNDLISVSIDGAIDYPGQYTLESNSTLDDLYKLVGDFKPEAFLEGVIFKRTSVRDRQVFAIDKSKDDLRRSILVNSQKGQNLGDVSAIKSLIDQSIDPESLGRIAGDFSPNSEGSNDILLLDGDTIFIPKIPSTINVLGEVLNPIAFQFEKNISIRKAIENAGGYRDYANKSKVYIIKANGNIQKADRNIFIQRVNLEAGDTIVVPRKLVIGDPGIQFLLPLTQILSDFAFSAAAIESLSNND